MKKYSIFSEPHINEAASIKATPAVEATAKEKKAFGIRDAAHFVMKYAGTTDRADTANVNTIPFPNFTFLRIDTMCKIADKVRPIPIAIARSVI